MRKFKQKATLYILLVCLLIPPLSGILGVCADELDDVNQEIITYPSSEDELMPTAMPSAMISERYLVLKVSQTADLTATYRETSTETTPAMWGASDSSIVSFSSSIGTSTTVTANKVGVTTITFSKGTVSTSIPVYVVESGISGTFFFQNIESKFVMDLKGRSLEEGATIQQWAYSSGATQQQWIISPSGNYYTIKSVYSNKYVGIQSTSNGAAVKQYATSTDNTKWIITRTPGGYYRLIPATCAETGYSMSLQTGASGYGVALFIYPYTNGADDRDEWSLSKGFGSQTYRFRASVTDKTAYVMCPDGRASVVSGSNSWYSLSVSTAEQSLLTIDTNSDVAMDDLRNTFSSSIKNAFESWLNSSWKSAMNATWSRETDFTGNGESKFLNYNQYRVVLRTGIEHDQSSNKICCDYQLWCQLYDGSWACIKAGDNNNSSIHLPSTNTPFSTSSQGWKFNTTDRFFTSEIYSYILTFN